MIKFIRWQVHPSLGTPQHRKVGYCRHGIWLLTFMEGAVASMGAGTRKLCVAYDVEHYSQRGTRREYATQQRLSDVLTSAFSEVGLTPGEYELQEQGDGGLALLPTGGSVDEPRLIVGLLTTLRTALSELNEDLVQAARVRLRVALHEGVVHAAPHGYVGPAVIEVCRLRDAAPVRNALANSNAVLVAVVADGLYRDVLSQGYHGLSGTAFTPVDVQVKTFSARAWIYLPGGPPLPGTDPADGASDRSGRPLIEQFLESKDTW
jgi:hypothetical protein